MLPASALNRPTPKVLLFLHGGTFPGTVAFDLDYENVSMMRHFAKLGWDTFALDLEGYGQSTRPPIMDEPEKYPDSQAPIGLDVTLADVGRTVDFIRDLRAVDKVHVLGWSSGAMAEAPLYAIQQPDKVAKLILYATNYLGKPIWRPIQNLLSSAGGCAPPGDALSAGRNRISTPAASRFRRW